jgi:hypothetical protein
MLELAAEGAGCRWLFRSGEHGRRLRQAVILGRLLTYERGLTSSVNRTSPDGSGTSPGGHRREKPVTVSTA